MNVFEQPGFEVYMPDPGIYDRVRIAYSTYQQARDKVLFRRYMCLMILLFLSINRIKCVFGLTLIFLQNGMIRLSYKREFGGRKTIKKARIENGFMVGEFNDFGQFQAFLDLEPPTINSLGSGDTVNLSSAPRIIFYPSDNFDIKHFRAELDGQWLRFTNDKGRAHIYKFDERCPYGVHELKVTVEDIAGNIATRTWWFKKYPYTPPRKVVKKKAVSKKKENDDKKKKKMSFLNIHSIQ